MLCNGRLSNKVYRSKIIS